MLNILHCLCDRLIFHNYYQLFHLLKICKNIFYQIFLFWKFFKTVHVFIRKSIFFLRALIVLNQILWVKYLKPSSDKFLFVFSRLEFINCILPIKNKFLFRINATFFPNLFGIKSMFTANFSNLQKLKWLS